MKQLGICMRRLVVCCSSLALMLMILALSGQAAVSQDSNANTSRRMVVVLGAPGTEDYGKQFAQWAGRWRALAESTGIPIVEIGLQESNESSDRDILEKQFAEIRESPDAETWVVLIGHGTFFRDVAKFNLRGPDVSAKDMAKWIQPIRSPLVIVNCASSSGPFINRLSGKNRTVVTATKSGSEQNFSRFGDYLSHAIGDISADLDHDDEVSLLEAFLSASGKVQQFYTDENRLSTEHALIDDNGDTLGTPASFFRGVRVIKKDKQGGSVDGRQGARDGIFRSSKAIAFNQQQREQRSSIEKRIEELRDSKSKIAVEEYFQKLEGLMIEMAELYEASEAEGLVEVPEN